MSPSCISSVEHPQPSLFLPFATSVIMIVAVIRACPLPTMVSLHASDLSLSLLRLDDQVREALVHQRDSSWSISLALRWDIRGYGWIVEWCESLGHCRSRQCDQCDVHMRPNTAVQQRYPMSVGIRFMASNGVFRVILALAFLYRSGSIDNLQC